MLKRKIVCNACGEDDYRHLSAVGEWSIGKCGKCGLVYLNPAPFFEPTPEFSLMSRSFQYTQYMHETITQEIYTFERKQLQRQQEELRRFTRLSLPSLKYLEVGCGSGASVRAAGDLGWDAVGVDIDPELIAEGIAQHGSDLRCTLLSKSGLSAESYDFVRLRDVIEHLPDPYDTLLEVFRLLRPGGVGLIVAPNEDAFVNRFRRVISSQRKMVAYAEPPHHIHGFGPMTLRLILQRAKFEILMIRTTIPVDAGYVTSNNMRSENRKGFVAIWRLGRLFGWGNFIVAWIRKPQV